MRHERGAVFGDARNAGCWGASLPSASTIWAGAWHGAALPERAWETRCGDSLVVKLAQRTSHPERQGGRESGGRYTWTEIGHPGCTSQFMTSKASGCARAIANPPDKRETQINARQKGKSEEQQQRPRGRRCGGLAGSRRW